MLTSIATIAGAITALITAGFAIYNNIKKKKAEAAQAQWEAEGLTLTQQINGATSDEERARLVKLLYEHGARK